MKSNKLILVRNADARVSSLVLADGCGVSHQAVLRLCKKYQSDFQELGIFGFQIRKNRGTQGRETEFGLLNEDQATLLITYLKNTEIVRKFKLTLVKEFRKTLNALRRLEAKAIRNKADPEWNKERRAISEILKAGVFESIKHTREEAGKQAEAKHFMCEARLMAWGVIGQFEGGMLDCLTKEQTRLYQEVARLNNRMVLRGLDYESRKTAIGNYVMSRTPLKWADLALEVAA